jgi:hypothetical protein
VGQKCTKIVTKAYQKRAKSVHKTLAQMHVNGAKVREQKVCVQKDVKCSGSNQISIITFRIMTLSINVLFTEF